MRKRKLQRERVRTDWRVVFIAEREGRTEVEVDVVFLFDLVFGLYLGCLWWCIWGVVKHLRCVCGMVVCKCGYKCKLGDK